MKKIYMLFFFLLIVLMLSHPQVCLQLGMRGLLLWFEKMIPALFPFMVLSGVIVRMNLSEDVVASLAPLLQPIFRVNRSVIYGIIMGFLCGFPMGAKVAVQLYEADKVTEKEAEYLLCFCNNIGPIYFLSFALPTLELSGVLPFIIGMYGLPLVYGILLRHTLFKKKLFYQERKEQEKDSLHIKQPPSAKKGKILDCLDAAMKDGISSMVMLGGYMIIFNALNLLPCILCPKYALWAAPFLEITGGIGLMGNACPRYILCLLPLGGLCCMAQTHTIISNTPLKVSKYMFHKLVLTGVTIGYYLLIL